MQDTKGNPNISQLKQGLIPFLIKNKGNKQENDKYRI